ncbi:MAG: di-trans,poly-cis-decaprenylcistransferase [Treponema sp.]|uniref:polyprenyl diphosphate synthase n=1 Tax=Treponema sp. TaxID=166 RepID=UPI00298E065D|nr:polyprenyl diphosphate synthase [Treponema sp.]MCR5385718.1 di-trans,poly-cis-decaprenylcistransferase [Treponema sp.]
MSGSAQTSDNSTPLVHVGIIMDGNGRWAKKRGLPRTAGHKEGLEVAKKIVKACAELNIKYVTLYTFSTENWKRAQEEVGYLMGLIRGHLRAEFEFYKANGIRIEHIGDLAELPPDVAEEILKAKKETENFTGLTVVLAINYGGRDELVRSVKKIVSSCTAEKDINEKLISDNFDIPELPDVDFLIRTGGEKRLSNFLMWHSAYSELFFTDTLWPDYTPEEFKSNVEEFYKRTRRFGNA